jgi:hypothetical protein
MPQTPVLQSRIHMKFFLKNCSSHQHSAVTGNGRRTYHRGDHSVLDHDHHSGLRPADREAHVLPGDREAHVLPGDREAHVLPGDREAHVLPGDRRGHVLPGDRRVHAPLEDRSDQVRKVVRVLPGNRSDHRGKPRDLARNLVCSPGPVARSLHHALYLEVHMKQTSCALLDRLGASLEAKLARALHHCAPCARGRRILSLENSVDPCHKHRTHHSPVHAHQEKALSHNPCPEASTRHAPVPRGDTHVHLLRHTPHVYLEDSRQDACRRERRREVLDEGLQAAMRQTRGHHLTNQAAVVTRANQPQNQGLPAAAGNVAKWHANHALRGGVDVAGELGFAGMADACPRKAWALILPAK